MNKYIKKHQKKFLAIFGVLLMITFVASTGVGGRAASRGGGGTVGTIHNGAVTVDAKRFNAYASHWRALKTHLRAVQLATVLGGIGSLDEQLAVRVLADQRMVDQLQQMAMQVRQSPFMLQFWEQTQPGMAAVARIEQRGEIIYSQFESHDDLFPLLAVEAESLGVGVNPDTIASVLTAQGLSRDRDPELYDDLSQQLHTLFMVAAGGDIAARVAKVSQAERSNMLATRLQEVSLDIVEYAIKDYLPKATEPTAEQVKEQFEKYKDVISSGAGTMGYKFSNRLTYDAVLIKRDEVKKGVPTVYLDEAKEYYYSHLDGGDFIATSQPSETGADALTLRPGPTTRLKKFDEVKEDIIFRLTDQRVGELRDKIRDAVLTTMRNDYDAFAAAYAGGKRPATAPVSSLGVPYDSKDYLGKLRDKIQKDFKVTLTIEREEGMQTPTTLAESKLGKEAFSLPDRGVSFTTLLTTRVEPFVSEAERKLPSPGNKPIAVWEPTPALTNFGGDVLVARVTAAEASRPPRSLDEVKDKVVADLKQVQAYKLAKEAAQSTVESARTNKKWLQAIANEQGKKLVTTGVFLPAQASTVPGYEVTPASARSFALGVTQLLTTPPRTGDTPRPASMPSTKPAAATTRAAAATTKPTLASAATTKPATTTAPTTAPTMSTALKDHPIGTIELPLDGKVLVAEVQELKPKWTKDALRQTEDSVALSRQQAAAGDLRTRWFLYPEAIKRMNFLRPDGKPPEDKSRQNQPPFSSDEE
jgi:hypothetical protein